MSVRLTVTAAADVTLTRLVENFPVVRGEWKARGATITAPGPTADQFTITDSRGSGVRVKFTAPQALRVYPEGLHAGNWRRYQFGRVEAVLPATWHKGQEATLDYTIGHAE